MVRVNGPALLSYSMALGVRHTQSSSVFAKVERVVQSAMRCINCAETEKCRKHVCFVAFYFLILDRNAWTQNRPLSVNQFLFLSQPVLMYGMDIFQADSLAMLSSDVAPKETAHPLQVALYKQI